MAPRYKVVAVNIVILLVLLSLIEAIGQVIASSRPAYDVLYLQPDNVVGWKQVPNHHWRWTGHHWYAADFTVDVQTNAQGFRDLERSVSKPADVRRIALLGDSFIEAVQVPFEKTAGQLLERALNFSSGQPGLHAGRWEVLNFGISNYGIGQYLLTFEQYAGSYLPDLVAIFVAKYHMERTVAKYEFSWTTRKPLWVRPTFRVEDGELVREPARDFHEFATWQDNLIRTHFDGQRSRRRRHLVTRYYGSQLKDRLKGLVNSSGADATAEAELVTLNFKIIEEMGRITARAGSKLVVLDASRYFGDDPAISTALKQFCSENEIGHVPVSDELMKAGVSTRWAHDAHFNEAGNEILAKALLRWMTERGHLGQRPD
jgi:hypothetical protein